MFNEEWKRSNLNFYLLSVFVSFGAGFRVNNQVAKIMTSSAEATPSNKIKSIFIQLFVTFPSISLGANEKFIQTNTSQTFTSLKRQLCSNWRVWLSQNYFFVHLRTFVFGTTTSTWQIKKQTARTFEKRFIYFYVQKRIKYISEKNSRLTQCIDNCPIDFLANWNLAWIEWKNLQWKNLQKITVCNQKCEILFLCRNDIFLEI